MTGLTDDYTAGVKLPPEMLTLPINADDFEPELALAVLLLKGEVDLNSHWFEDTWPDEAKKSIGVYANCNDIFAWAHADSEEVPYDDLHDLWCCYVKDPAWGVAIWCIKKRGMMPQKPAADLILEAGVWNLDEMGLNPNEF